MTEHTLEDRYKDDPQLLAFYKAKLPKPGWAGVTDDVERAYIHQARRRQDRPPRGKPFQPRLKL